METYEVTVAVTAEDKEAVLDWAEERLSRPGDPEFTIRSVILQGKEEATTSIH